MGAHNVTIENREKITLTDVTGIDTLDEEEVWAELSETGVVIRGKNLHMHMLDLEEGVAVITGEADSLAYVKKPSGKKLFHRIMK